MRQRWCAADEMCQIPCVRIHAPEGRARKPGTSSSHALTHTSEASAGRCLRQRTHCLPRQVQPQPQMQGTLFAALAAWFTSIASDPTDSAGADWRYRCGRTEGCQLVLRVSRNLHD